MLSQKTETTSKQVGEVDIVSADFGRFLEYLFQQRHVSDETKVKVAALPPDEIYSLCADIGVSEAELARHIANFCNLEYIDHVEPEDLKLGVLPLNFCVSNQIVVIDTLLHGSAFVFCNPFRWQMLDSLRVVARRGLRFHMMLTSPEVIARLLSKRGHSPAPERRRTASMSELEEKLRQKHQPVSDEIDIRESDEESAPIIELVNQIIEMTTGVLTS